ncbi:hypothetical protein AB0H86_12265 [Streptomyces sp. NPDC050997]|uniref:hypothetical protein n=1 Tax=Streptomyces sp. NPDC050997 TaxID=3155519 RepID=UPI00342379A8
MTTAEADTIPAADFAPWFPEPGLPVEALADDRATARLPWSDRVSRESREVWARSLAAAVGTAIVVAAPTARGVCELPPTERRSAPVGVRRPVRMS